ncbi:hypothetical protein YC2023_010789 [Brassica napus]
MQIDIWEEWWRPACVLDMQPAMWSTRRPRACVWSHAKRHTGCHQPEADWLLSSINSQDLSSVSTHADLSKPMPREGSVQLKVNQVKISSDGKQVNVAREGERNKVVNLEYSRFSPRMPVPSNRRFYTIVTRKLCPNDSVQSSNILLQSSGVEVLLDTPPGSPKNCPEAKGGSVRVKISMSRPVSFFMVKPRLCPRQDQSSPLQSSRQLGFGQVFSDQPAASRLEHCELACCRSRRPNYLGNGLIDGFKETPYSLDREDTDRRGHGLWLSITRRCNVAVSRRTVGCRAVTRRTVGRGRLKVPSSGLCGRKIGYCR